MTTAFTAKLQEMTDLQLANAALATLSAIMQMSDRAKTNGGATSIGGVASLHTMQTSIQRNGPRLAELAQEIVRRANV